MADYKDAYEGDPAKPHPNPCVVRENVCTVHTGNNPDCVMRTPRLGILHIPDKDEWPGKVETHDLLSENLLNMEQERRLNAIYHAKGILGRNVEGFAKSGPPNITDMIRLANYIIDGGKG